MITTLNNLPTEQLQKFLDSLSTGVQSYVISDSSVIVAFKKVFDVDTGVEVRQEAIASVPVQDVKDEITRLAARSDMIQAFITSAGL